MPDLELLRQSFPIALSLIVRMCFVFWHQIDDVFLVGGQNLVDERVERLAGELDLPVFVFL